MHNLINASTFDKHKKLVLEHLNIREAETQAAADAGHHYKDMPRDPQGRVSHPDISYQAKEVKGKIDKVIATLTGNHSGAYTSAITKLNRVEELEAEVAALKEEVKQEGVREKIAALFGAEHEFVTRVIRTVSAYELMLSKQPKPAETTKWAEVYKELAEKLTPELLVIGESIVKKYTTTQEPKPPALKVSKIAEGLGDVWNAFLGKIKQWGQRFDAQLNGVIGKIKQL
jgi:hypothetical protein